MSDEAALVRAIQDNPTDDIGRLAYADWLDEYGTTDQHRARAEWIRLVCWTPATRKDRRTGKRHRVPGERAWIKANAPRLWPHLHALKAKWWKHGVHATLLTGNVVLSVPLAVPFERRGRRGLTTGEEVDHTQVSIFCDRGVATVVYVTLLRAERVAPRAAKDEPFAALKFATLPDRCYADPLDGNVAFYRRPFVMRGLGGVWDAIPGEPVQEFPNGDETKSTPNGQAANEALTRWARGQAVNPLVFHGEGT